MEQKIKIELLQKVIDYLAGRPYREVFELINQLLNLEKLKEENEKNNK